MSAISTQSLGRTNAFVRQIERTNQQVSTSLERLSTGKRINRASDDPSGFVVAEGLRGDLVELRAESRSSQAERSNLHQTQSKLAAIQGIATDIRGKLVTAGDGLITASQRQAIQQEIDASLDAIDRVADGSSRVSDPGSLGALRTGRVANVVDGDIEFAATLVESKTSSLNRTRAALAAYERTQLDTFDRIREDQIVITTEALSQVEDADFAQESANFVQGQILSRAAAEALTFSTNELKEQLESLLDGIKGDNE